MKRWYLLATLGIGLVLAAGRTIPVNAAGKCASFSGIFRFVDFHFTSATTAVADAKVEGDLAGTAHANYFNIRQMGHGVTQMNGTHTITITQGPLRGTLTTYDEIHLQTDSNSPWARANSRLIVMHGTGDFAGWTGVLHTHGTVNLATLEGGIGFKGQLCPP